MYRDRQNRIPAKRSNPSAIMCDYIVADLLVQLDLTQASKLISMFVTVKEKDGVRRRGRQ